MERRQVQFLELSVQGKTSTEIAKVLNCSRTTVYSVVAKGTPEATTKYKSITPRSDEMVAAVKNSDRHVKCDLIFLEDHDSLNSETYCQYLEDKVFPWPRATYGDRWSWHKDGASCHTNSFTQEFLQIETPAFFDRNCWLPHSPDCSPIDFAVFGLLKGMLSGVQYKSKDQLKSALKNA
uniref:HTH luxR-type domain-containing protein n=1 Tax=Lepeophtheirus salmonis TaxID=72036 RepID=A0A0K2VBF1_LEPSM